MSDLSSMYSMMLEATNPATWEKNYQRQKMGEMELTEKQRAMEDEQRLRQIYSSGRQPSMQELMSINPRFGLEQQKANYELMKENAGIQKTQAEIAKLGSEEHAKKAQIFANALGPVVENYMSSGQQNPYQFKQIIGSTLAQIENIHGIKPDVPFEDFAPEQILQSAESFGYPSQRMNMQMESKKRMLPPGMTPEQKYGRVEMGPYGPKVQPPLPDASLPSGGYRPGYAKSVEQQYGQPEPESNIPAQDIDAFREYKDSLPANSKERQAAEKALANAIKQNLPGSRFVTPEEETRLNIEKEAELTKAKETTKSDVQRVEEGKRITESFKRAMGEGGVSRVMKMISESTSGATESLAAKVVGAAPFSKATPGMENIGALNTIAGELRKTIERSPGAQSDKDVALAALDAAAIADPSIPYNQRMKGFLEFTRIIKERAKDLGIDPKELGIDVDTSTGSSMPTAKTDEEAERLVKTLKPGDSFIGPDGKTHKIKGL